MKLTLRDILAESHVGAAAIAVLVIWSLDGASRALWGPVSRIAGWLLTAIAIFDIPYFSATLTTSDRLILITTCSYLYSAAVSFSAAWFLSQWLYGAGPIRTLVDCRNKLRGRKDA